MYVSFPSIKIKDNHSIWDKHWWSDFAYENWTIRSKNRSVYKFKAVNSPVFVLEKAPDWSTVKKFNGVLPPMPDLMKAVYIFYLILGILPCPESNSPSFIYEESTW